MPVKDKVYAAYIKMEQELGEVERCRKLHEGFLAYNPANCKAWISFASLEKGFQEIARARQILELAVSQPLLDTPELLWKFYIDFELSLNEYDNARSLYRRLLDRTKHTKVWLSFAEFEQSLGKVDAMRSVFDEADKYFASPLGSSMREERASLLEKWLKAEQAVGTPESIEAVKAKQPRKVKRRRALTAEDGVCVVYIELNCEL